LLAKFCEILHLKHETLLYRLRPFLQFVVQCGHSLLLCGIRDFAGKSVPRAPR